MDIDLLANKIVRKLAKGGYLISDDFREIEIVKKKKVRSGVPHKLLPYVVANAAIKGKKFRFGIENKSLIVDVLAKEYDHNKTPEKNLEIFKSHVKEMIKEGFTGVMN